MFYNGPQPPPPAPSGCLVLHVIFFRSQVKARQEEYCVTLLEVLKQAMVQSVHLYVNMSVLTDVYKFSDDALGRKLSIYANIALGDLTYGCLLRNAGRRAGPSSVQVVMNSDIVLGGWPVSQLRACLNEIHVECIVFHPARHEPTQCYPLLDGRPRTRLTENAPLINIYTDFCIHPNLCALS